MSYTIGGLTVYQCKANFSDLSNQFAISLNKNDMVKVLDKQDHGTWVHSNLFQFITKHMGGHNVSGVAGQFLLHPS